MNSLDEIIKQQMIFSYENNISFRNQVSNIFNIHFNQNIKYHIIWLFFHSFSFAYPDNPSEEYKIETAHFISNIIPKNLSGCGGCQNDYKTYIENLNIFRIVSSKKELSTFFVNLHNYINKNKFELNLKMLNNSKQINVTINDTLINESPINFNYEDVKNKYEKNDFISILEKKYNINMFKLIENQSLSKFYDELNKIKLDNNTFNVKIEIL